MCGSIEHESIQRVHLLRRVKSVHVGNCFLQRDALLIFFIQLMQMEHVRFEFGGERAILFHVAPDVGLKQLGRVSVQLSLDLLKRFAIDLALLS